MQRIVKFTMASVLFFAVGSCSEDKQLNETEFPAAISKYVDKHFPDNKILQVTQEKEGISNAYEVVVSDNFKLEFDKNKDLTCASGSKEIPSSIVPNKIARYVKDNYPDNVITEWELDGKEEKVKLDNGMQLEFNSNHEFLRID